MNIGHLGGQTPRLFWRTAPDSCQSTPSKIQVCEKFNEMYVPEYQSGRIKEKTYIGTTMAAYESSLKI